MQEKFPINKDKISQELDYFCQEHKGNILSRITTILRATAQYDSFNNHPQYLSYYEVAKEKNNSITVETLRNQFEKLTSTIKTKRPSP